MKKHIHITNLRKAEELETPSIKEVVKTLGFLLLGIAVYPLLFVIPAGVFVLVHSLLTKYL